VRVVLQSLLVTSVVAAPVVTAAQESTRPYRGLFGGGVGRWDQSLVANASVGTGYDTSAVLDLGDLGLGAKTPAAEAGGASYGLFSGSLSYALSRRRLAVTSGLAVSSRYYPQFTRDRFASSYSATAGLGLNLSRRLDTTRPTHLSIDETVTYQPYTLFTLFPQLAGIAGGAQPTSIALADAGLGQVPIVDQDFTAQHVDYYSYTTAVSLNRALSRRWSGSFGYSYHYSDLPSNTADFWSQSATARASTSFTRYMGLHIGYGVVQGQYWDYDTDGVPHSSKSVFSHNIDVGLDYSRSLSLTRRTTLGFSTGAAAVSDRHTTRYSGIGSANLARQIGRTWTASLSYNRSVAFIEILREPVFYDGVSAAIGGLLGRRISVQGSVGTAFGNIGGTQNNSVGGRRNPLDSYYGNAGMNIGLTRNLALGVSYMYYHYTFNTSAFLPIGFPQQLDRHSVRATLNAWVPVIQRARRR